MFSIVCLWIVRFWSEHINNIIKFQNEAIYSLVEYNTTEVLNQLSG